MKEDNYKNIESFKKKLMTYEYNHDPKITKIAVLPPKNRDEAEIRKDLLYFN